MKNKIPAWSYSSIQLFKLCPLKYKHLRILKDVKEPESEAIMYGTELHKAAELYVKDRVPLPGKFSFMQSYMDKIDAIPGNKLTEHKLGLKIEKGKIVPSGFFAVDVWYRGVVDLISLDNAHDRAVLIDYKSGKNSKYADMLQMELMASLVFMHFSHIKKIRAGLMFVVAKDFIKADYEAPQKLTVFSKLSNILEQREKAYETGVFNPIQNFSCKNFCAVTSCAFNGRRK